MVIRLQRGGRTANTMLSSHVNAILPKSTDSIQGYSVNWQFSIRGALLSGTDRNNEANTQKSHIPSPPYANSRSKHNKKITYKQITTGELTMTIEELRLFQETLKCLPFCGSSIKDFAEQINVKPHTLYNYICGQYPSDKYYRFILYTLEKEYPQAIETAKSIIQRG